MKDLIAQAVANIMEQHFDDETIELLYREQLIECKHGFKTTTQATLELELEDLVRKVTYPHNNAPRY